MHRFFKLILIASLAVILPLTAAMAQDCTLSGTTVCNGIDCSNETRPEGSIVYNADFDVHQVCLAGRWQALGGIVENSCTTTDVLPGIGDSCDDGTIYAGRTPDGNRLMYTTAADAASTYTWNDGSSNYQDTAMENCTDLTPGTASSCQTGVANTAFLVGATGEPDYPFAAAEYCDGLSAHGHTDWYLPAQDELDVLYTNKNTGDLDGTFDESGTYGPGYYWSSSERATNYARYQRFSDGTQINGYKNVGLSVRCVRTDR